MLTKEVYRAASPQVPNNIEMVEYPPEVVARLEAEVEIARLQLATGEIRPMSIAEIATAVGL